MKRKKRRNKGENDWIMVDFDCFKDEKSYKIRFSTDEGRWIAFDVEEQIGQKLAEIVSFFFAGNNTESVICEIVSFGVSRALLQVFKSLEPTIKPATIFITCRNNCWGADISWQFQSDSIPTWLKQITQIPIADALILAIKWEIPVKMRQSELFSPCEEKTAQKPAVNADFLTETKDDPFEILSDFQHELKVAVTSENFQLAIKLRNRIRSLKSELGIM